MEIMEYKTLEYAIREVLNEGFYRRKKTIKYHETDVTVLLHQINMFYQ